MSSPGEGGLFELVAFNFDPSPGFVEWLEAVDASLCFTTGAQLGFVGRGRDGELTVELHQQPTAAGLASSSGQTLHVASGWQLVRLENAVLPGRRDERGRDRVFLTQTARTIGSIVPYDVVVTDSGRLLFSSALCNCVGTPADRLNFTAVWKPPFVSKLVGEDRCHLTGLCVEHEELAYVTCCSTSDTADGWRATIADGGVVVDVRTGGVLATGLSLPHSPRLHDGRLFVANAGRGELLEIDRKTGGQTIIAKVAGLARGLAFAGGAAIVGSSRLHDDGPYLHAPVGDAAAAAHKQALVVVDVDSRSVLHELVLAGGTGEIFSIEALAGVTRPGLAQQRTPSHEQISVGPT